MITIKKICPACEKEIKIGQFTFGKTKDFVEEFDVDELIGIGMDCPHCQAHITFEEQAWDENGNQL